MFNCSKFIDVLILVQNELLSLASLLLYLLYVGIVMRAAQITNTNAHTLNI